MTTGTLEGHLPAQPFAAPADPGLAPAAIRHILFPSDLSQAADRSFDHARMLAEAFGAAVTLYHAVEVATARQLDEVRQPERERRRRAERDAREHLEHQALALSGLGRVVVESTRSPADALLALIEGLGPDLTVMATHGRAGIGHLMLGSVTDRVVRGTSCPVLCVREPAHGTSLAYRRLLVPTDLSRASRRAFPIAALLARRFGAGVLALHVAPRPALASLSGIPYLVERRLPSEQTLRQFVQPAFAGLEVECRVELGSAWNLIVETAGVERTDLIVMSTHGHDSLPDRLLGSHTEAVVKHAPCPVLVA
jgi:nucleotide-binding universal stress UspA family protein